MDIAYQCMIPVLQYFAKTTQSYGMAIVLLTVLVRVCVWPLVASSTKNMQKMQKLSPMLKKIQEKYKDEPEVLQKKMMEFWSANKVNPAGGCLPMLIQLPILFALFGTFNGPPFGDKPVDVSVKVVNAKDVSLRKHDETSKSNSPYVSKDGEVGKVVVFPGESTVVEGDAVDFATRVVEGKVPSDFKVKWTVVQGAKEAPPAEATVDENGHATFFKAGDYKINAIVDGVAKNDSFLFITSLGKKATGLDLLKPFNFDLLFLIVSFGATMYLSSKLTMGAKQDPAEMDEQQKVQADTMKMMPLMMMVTFFMIPLPAGVYLYMTVSNLFQTIQTWLLMQQPAPDLIDPDAPDAKPAPGGPVPGTIPPAAKKQGSSKVVDIDLTPKEDKNGKTEDAGAKININKDKLTGETAGQTVEKGKSKKKKKK